MGGTTRRAFLHACAAALGSVAWRSHAAACSAEPAAPPGESRSAAIFLEDSRAPQGARLEELRARMAAHDVGEPRVRLEAVNVDALDAERMRCAIEAGAARAPLAFCAASTRVASAAIRHTGAVPLVFALRSDPIAIGVVDRLGMRRANATGFTHDTTIPIDFKCFELLVDAFPKTQRIVVLADEEWMARRGRTADLARVRARLNVAVAPIVVATPWEITPELRRLDSRPNDAFYLPQSDVLLHGVAPLVGFLQRRRIPHLCGDERTLRQGAMLAYAGNRLAAWDAMAAMLKLIAAGTAAGEIPVQRPSEFTLSINLAQWQRLGIAVPPRLLRRAHVVI